MDSHRKVWIQTAEFPTVFDLPGLCFEVPEKTSRFFREVDVLLPGRDLNKPETTFGEDPSTSETA